MKGADTQSTQNSSLLLRARVVFPVSRAPIRDGAVHIAGNRIKNVGRWRDLAGISAEVVDLGDVILMPGLVNAHCHLDYTTMAGTIPPQKKFTDWIKLITTAKSGWSFSEFAESWLAGIRMLERTGTTTVADIEAAPDMLPEMWTASPMRIISFIEMTGVKSRRDPRKILREAVKFINTLPSGSSRASLSPHAPYSTVPKLLRYSAETARRRRWPITTHIAESIQEFEMFMHARGDLYDWLRRNDRNMDDCGLGSPVQHVHRAGLLGKNFLAVHVNYLAPGDAGLLGKSKSSVAHCPRSHAYFAHGPFPYSELTTAKVNVCLGTDSLITVRKKPRQHIELNMFAEMRAFSAIHPDVPPKTVVQMATVNGARALGMAGDIGELSKSAYADLIAIPYKGKTSGAAEAVVNHSGDVEVSLINGQWVIAPK